MRPIFFITIIILFLLTACGTPAPQVTVTSEVTVTLTPAATLTASPTFTETPISTAIPTLTPDQQIALDAAKAIYSATGWEIQPSGEVIGAPEGVTYNVEKGVLTHTYMYEGIELTVDMTINTETPMPEGAKLNFEGWVALENGTLARKTFRTERLQDGTFGIGGYGYVGDGNPEHEGNVVFLSPEEQQIDLTNPEKVDMSGKVTYDMLLTQVLKHDRKYRGNKVFFNGDTPESSAIVEPRYTLTWGDYFVYYPDPNGVPSTVFSISKLTQSPVSLTRFVKPDGTLGLMAADIPNLMGASMENLSILDRWSTHYSETNTLPTIW